MGRWEPDAKGRLEHAALELYRERGFENTTVAEIAERAGLTERTFFRHYADKREVLFAGASVLQELLVTSVGQAALQLPPVEAVTTGLVEVSAILFNDRHDQARQRQVIIDANAELRERELIKLASLASAIAAALRERGVGEPVASLAAEAGMAVFKVAFQRWIADAGERPLSVFIEDSAGELRRVTAGG